MILAKAPQYLLIYHLEFSDNENSIDGKYIQTFTFPFFYHLWFGHFEDSVDTNTVDQQFPRTINFGKGSPRQHFHHFSLLAHFHQPVHRSKKRESIFIFSGNGVTKCRKVTFSPVCKKPLDLFQTDASRFHPLWFCRSLSREKKLIWGQKSFTLRLHFYHRSWRCAEATFCCLEEGGERGIAKGETPQSH